MRPKRLAYMFMIAYFPLLVVASEELQYSPEYVDTTTTGKTILQIWEHAIITNPDILITNRKVSEARALRRQAAAFPNPEFQVNAGSSSILGEPGDREWGASLVQTFELGGKRSKRIRAADLSVEIAEQEMREKQRQIRWELQQAYAELLVTAGTIHTTEEALGLNEQSHVITLARVQQGESAAVEKAVSEVELNRLKADLANLKAEGTRSLSKLKRLAGITQPLKIRPLEGFRSIRDVNLETLTSQALSSRPDFKLATLQVDLSEAEISLAKAEGISDVETFVEFSHERSSFDQFGIGPSGNPVPLIDQDKILSGGVSISLPLFNRNQGNIQAAQARVEAARIRKAAMESMIRQEVQVAMESVQIAQTNFLLFRDSIMNQSEKQLAVLQASYRAGEFRFLDLINEQKRALEIRKSYINSARGYFMALAELEFVTATDLAGGKQ